MVFLTGAAALVYELAWTRWLTLLLGAGTQSLAVITASTMLGFALGAALLSPRIDRARLPLRVYGALEVAIGLSAAVVSWVLRAGTTAAWSAALPRPALIVLVLALVGVPTAFMGATLPALVAHVTRRSADAMRGGISALYASNTAGAVLGTLATGFFLIEHVGYTAAALVGISLNLVVGATAMAFAGRDPYPESTPESAATSPARESATPDLDAARVARDATLAAGVSGFATLGHEVLSTRLLVYGFHATTHALAIVLAVFLLGLALGARAVAGPLRRATARPEHMGLALLAAAALSLGFAPSLLQTSTLVEGLRGHHVGWWTWLTVEALIAAALLLPTTFAMGLVFPLAMGFVASSRKPGETVGRAVWVNTLASVAGSLGAGFVLVPALGVRASIVALTLVQALAGAYLFARHARARRYAGWAGVAGVALFGALWAERATVGAPPGEHTLVPRHIVGHESEYRVRCYREGPTATTEVVEHLPTGRHDVMIDGFVAAGNASTAGYMDLMGRLPMALHPDPQRALVICFGTGATARAVGSFAQSRVDIVDINPDVFACAGAFGPENPRLLARAGVHVEDGRAFLRAPSNVRYDVITQEPMPPHFAGVSALYSVEYYRLARARLTDDGVLVQWLPMHITAPDDARQIAAAALAVFPETWLAVTAGDLTGLLVSSPRAIPEEARRRVGNELRIDFTLDPAGVARFVAGSGPVTDDRPALEYNGIDRVYGQFGSSRSLLRYNLRRVGAALRP
jgi:predicted membrane-bound spermidine synthase